MPRKQRKDFEDDLEYEAYIDALYQSHMLLERYQQGDSISILFDIDVHFKDWEY